MLPSIFLAYRTMLAVLGIPQWVPVAGLCWLLSAGGAYLYGKHVAAAACHEAELRTTIANMQRDVTAQNQALEVAAAETAAAESQRQKLESEVADYAAALKARPAESGCSLTPDDLSRMPGHRRR